MAVAPYPVSPLVDNPPPQPPPARGEGDSRREGDSRKGERHTKGQRESTPDEILVTAILEGSAAEVGWLAWRDGKDAVVIRRVASSSLHPSAIGEFPDPPLEPLVIDRGRGAGPWFLWCRAPGILSSAITPVFARGRVVGVVALAPCPADPLAAYHRHRLHPAQALA